MACNVINYRFLRKEALPASGSANRTLPDFTAYVSGRSFETAGAFLAGLLADERPLRLASEEDRYWQILSLLWPNFVDNLALFAKYY